LVCDGRIGSSDESPYWGTSGADTDCHVGGYSDEISHADGVVFGSYGCEEGGDVLKTGVLGAGVLVGEDERAVTASGGHGCVPCPTVMESCLFIVRIWEHK